MKEIGWVHLFTFQNQIFHFSFIHSAKQYQFPTFQFTHLSKAVNVSYLKFLIPIFHAFLASQSILLAALFIHLLITRIHLLMILTFTWHLLNLIQSKSVIFQARHTAYMPDFILLLTILQSFVFDFIKTPQVYLNVLILLFFQEREFRLKTQFHFVILPLTICSPNLKFRFINFHFAATTHQF